MWDILSFIAVEFIIIALMASVLQVLGVKFDDGIGLDLDDYDTDHNDYPLIWAFGVSALSVYRNAVGDLQMPSYDYWTAMYEESGKTDKYPQFMIFLIWALYIVFTFFLVLMALNFFIAIVS